MPTYSLNALMLVLLSFLSCASGAATVKLCDDEGGWPPYTFVDPKNPQAVIGASTELVTEILKRAGHEAHVAMLPWKRCLSEVEAGNIAIVMDATYNEERAQKYLLTKPLYLVHGALFYLKSKYPTAPKLASAADMKKYRYCGLFGYNYAMYEIPEGQIDMASKNEVSRFKALRQGHCDFVLGDLEILKAFASMGQLDLDGTGHIAIPGAKPKEFLAMVSKAPIGGEPLLKIINDGVVALKADKTYDKIFKKYGM